MQYLDHRHNLVQTFQDKLFNTNVNESILTKGMVDKIAEISGLLYDDLEKTYSKFGQDGLVALLDTLRLTFTANGQPLANFFILQFYYNGFYTSFKIY